ncbi:GSCFA domain-containing protein [Pontibacter sp. HSC-14F20]|uniref:GSCFA domain-containing protein n=1 Tax=Pontibacter sp. HSC-14F20 TaxID=2864136 RepID=UPI001C73A5F6|nr:GSCFA domain-containing protein [Pontibacter sp. HSC-14F20]MBX0333197.1 GSCFA domain-containing protein [Pontibacter sp. HSC-14F20]
MFRTELHIPASGIDLSLSSGIVTIGSCFAEVIGQRLQENKAQVLVNPFGTIFNPLSVGKLLRAAISGSHTVTDKLVQHNGIWYAYDLHSSLSSPSRETLLQNIDERLSLTRNSLQQASLLIITLGTAVGYRLQNSGAVVANCHKLPAREFSRELLSFSTLLNDMEHTLEELRQFNPGLRVLFTVSPVRHIKETIEVNSVSKSILRLLCHDITTNHEQAHYFPAYEIMMDDLRDYRFYGRDMVHPTEVAEDYIWDKFVNAYLSEDFRGFLKAWEKMRRAIAHRPFHPDSEAHQSFLKTTFQQLHELSTRYSLDISEEEKGLQQQLVPKP